MGRKKPFIIMLVLFFGCFSPFFTEEATAMPDCSGLIKAGQYREVSALAKSAVRSDRWDAEAQACLTVASYLAGRRGWAVRKLREAEDALPREVLDRIHDRIWELLPELLAEKEFRDTYTMKGGACILRNVTAIDGTGQLLIGEFFNPLTSTTNRHLRGIRCSGDGKDCSEEEQVCKDCELRKAEALISVRAYEVTEVRILSEGVQIARNLRYIKKILELDRK